MTAWRHGPDDGYMDATAMCKANGKEFASYWRNKATKEFVRELAYSLGFPMESLLESQTGRHGGTYVHPKLAMHLAQWCSPKFAVVVSGWVLDLLTTGKAEVTPPPSDPILAQVEMVRSLRLAQLDQERRLSGVESKVDDAGRKAEMALREAEAAHRTADGNCGWFSVLGWANDDVVDLGRKVGRLRPVAALWLLQGVAAAG